MATFKSPKELAKLIDDDYERSWGPAKTPLLPPKDVSGYDKDLDYYLNTIDPTIAENEGKQFDYGKVFIDNAYDFYEDAPKGYQVPKEHYDYIHNKVADLINTKYDYLKPYYKRG